MTNPGVRVLITQDCRDGHTATGKYGIYEGNFSYSVELGQQFTEDSKTKWVGECGYEEYKSGFALLKDGTPVKDVYLEWELLKEQPRPYFAIVMTNPRIRLEDGSVIWGAECWWSEAKDGLTLEDSQKDLKEFQKFIEGLTEQITIMENKIK